MLDEQNSRLESHIFDKTNSDNESEIDNTSCDNLDYHYSNSSIEEEIKLSEKEIENKKKDFKIFFKNKFKKSKK